MQHTSQSIKRISVLILLMLAIFPNISSFEVQAAGPVQAPNKFVGILYETWFDRYAPYTQYVYPNIPSSEGGVLWWGIPAQGFYTSSNTAIINQHANQLADAGVDFIVIDISNRNIQSADLWNPTIALLNTYANRTSPTPKIVFLTSTTGNDLQLLYDRVYNQYYQLLFKYGSKPLLMTFPNDANNPGCNAAINGQSVNTYFECKPTQGLMAAGPYWSFINHYPQPYYAKNEWAEEIAVSAAQQSQYMSLPQSHGRKWNYRTGSNNGYNGQNFDDQWSRVQVTSPSFVIVTGWNQWVAHRINGQFTDAYSPEFSNDIEPMSGGHGSWYLDRLKQQIQAYKRNSPDFYLYDTNQGKWYFKEGRGGVSFAQGNYTRTFNWPNGPGYQPFVGDFNNDGLMDIGVRNPSNGTWYFAFSNGNGTYSNTQNFVWPSSGSFQPVIGDFNDDGKTDIGLRDPGTGTWYFAFSNGNGTYSNTRNFTWSSPANYQPIVGDFNSDGKTDIGLRGPNTGTWYFAFSNGSGSYSNTRNFDWPSPANYQPWVGDFNCDGLTDIALRGPDNGQFFIANYNGASHYDNNTNYQWRSGSQYSILTQPDQCRAGS